VYVGFRCAKQGVEKAKSTSSAKQPASQPVHAAPAQALPTTPASKPTNPPSTTPASVPTSVKTTDGGCDEVSCTVGSTTGPCCDKFEKSARPSAAPDGQPGLHGGSGSDLPETLDRMMITTSVAAIAAAAHACGDESPRAKGRVKIRVRVAPSGTVENAEVTEAPSPTLGRCVVKAMQRAQFPKTRSGGFFTHPFTF
jgi:TonB family protein